MLVDHNYNKQVVQRFYESLNAFDIKATLTLFDPDIERIEPEGFPSSGTFQGLAEFERILNAGRGTWAEGGCEPEELIAIDDKIVALVHVKVRLKDKTEWIDARIADGFTLANGKIKRMQTFVERSAALKWAGLQS